MGRLSLALLLLASVPAYAGDIDDDTASRHDRATPSSSSSSSESGTDTYDTYDTYDDDYDYGRASSGAAEPLAAAADLQLGGGVLFDRMAGLNGARVVHQDALGFGVDVAVAFFGRDSTRAERSGWFVAAGYGRAPLLSQFTPRGASYSSTLVLHSIEVDAGPVWVRDVYGAEVRTAIGFGLALLRSHEEFSDDRTLDENLALGVRVRPHVSLAPANGASRPFVELGLGVFLGHVTDHVDEYDSLIDGLFPVMVTPYARAGYLVRTLPGLWLGGTYELGVVGTVWANPSLTHRGQLVVRITGEDHLPASSGDGGGTAR
jgi:hypothetical protein